MGGKLQDVKTLLETEGAVKRKRIELMLNLAEECVGSKYAAKIIVDFACTPGADPFVEDPDGKTAVDLASSVLVKKAIQQYLEKLSGSYAEDQEKLKKSLEEERKKE